MLPKTSQKAPGFRHGDEWHGMYDIIPNVVVGHLVIRATAM